MKHFGFKYKSGKHTTIGIPNSKTGRFDIAGNLVVFTTRSDRDAWLMAGANREPLTSRSAREHCLGMSVACYKDYIEMETDVLI